MTLISLFILFPLTPHEDVSFLRAGISDLPVPRSMSGSEVLTPLTSCGSDNSGWEAALSLCHREGHCGSGKDVTCLSEETRTQWVWDLSASHPDQFRLHMGWKRDL